MATARVLFAPQTAELFENEGPILVVAAGKEATIAKSGGLFGAAATEFIEIRYTFDRNDQSHPTIDQGAEVRLDETQTLIRIKGPIRLAIGKTFTVASIGCRVFE
jgi:hypothetical protein